MALAYFSVCLRRSLVTRASREVSACVGDRLTAAYRLQCRGAGSRGERERDEKARGHWRGERRRERDVHAKVHERTRETPGSKERERATPESEREKEHTHASATWRGVPLI